MVAAGALLVVPQTPRAWAAPTVGGDENGPKVQILSPAYQDVLKGRARILVGVKATQFNPSTIQLFLDEQPASKVLSLSAFASSSFDWDTTKVSDGTHKLSVRVTDTQGFRGWAEVSVYINNQNVRDTLAPDLSWNNITPFQQLSGVAQLEIQAKDNFGVKWIIVSLNPVAKAKQQPAQRSWLLSRPPYKLDLDTTKVADGLYALSARAWDSMEQEGQSPMLTVGIVNSPVNATTVGETLDALRAQDEAQRKTTNVAAKPKRPVFVNPPTTQKSDVSSGAVKPQTKANSTSKAPTVVTPRGAQPTIENRVEVAQNPTQTPVTAPVLSARGERAGARTLVPTSNDAAPSTSLESETRVARLTEPGGTQRPVEVPATLAATNSADVLAPSRLGEAPTADATNEPVFVAKLDTPATAPRIESQALSAALSAPVATDEGALAPALTPDTVAQPKERVEIARLAVPASEARALEVTPVLSPAKTQFSGTVSASQSVRDAAESKPALVASVPGSKTHTSRLAKVTVRPYQRAQHTVSKVIDTTKPRAAQTTDAASQPSQPKTQNSGVVTTPKTGASLPKVAPRIAARPRTDANPVEVAPDSSSMERPSITVSPVQTAFNTRLPAFYQAGHKTTLRAIAAHFKLPVELVAAENNWTTDMHILPGMKVRLPRQVQLSYNGQKVRGEVASLLAGDTAFTGMRFLFEHTGGTITWDAKKQEVVARKGDSTVRVQIGSKTASVNNKEVMMQLAAFLFEGRTMVPARFFEEGLDAQVEWNPETGRLVVAMAG